MSESFGAYLDSLDPTDLIEIAIERTRKRLDALLRLRELMDAPRERSAPEPRDVIELLLNKAPPSNGHQHDQGHVEEAPPKRRLTTLVNGVISPIKFAVMELMSDGEERSAEQITSLTHGSASDPCWTEERDRLLIEAADALHDNSDIGDGLWARLAEVWGTLPPWSGDRPQSPPLGYRGCRLASPDGRAWTAFRELVVSGAESRRDEERVFERTILASAHGE